MYLCTVASYLLTMISFISNHYETDIGKRLLILKEAKRGNTDTKKHKKLFFAHAGGPTNYEKL